jgi:L-lactate dehydrogenase (cytochrome)
MPAKAWAYYSSAADDEITNRENHAAYHRQIGLSQNHAPSSPIAFRIWFRPKILIDVTEVDFSTFILGHKTTMPIYIVCDPSIRPCSPQHQIVQRQRQL